MVKLAGESKGEPVPIVRPSVENGPSARLGSRADSREHRNTEPSGCYGDDRCSGLPAHVLRIRLFSLCLDDARSPTVCTRGSLPLRRYWRSKPVVSSLL